MVKRMLAILLSLLLLVGVFSGCGKKTDPDEGNTTPTTAEEKTTEEEPTVEDSVVENGVTVNKTGYPIVSEKITVKGMMPDNARKPYNQNKTAEWLEEKTGIKVDMLTIASDVYQDKLNIAFAGGDYPDFIYMADLNRIQQTTYGADSGYLIDMKPLIEEGWAPEIKAFYDQDENYYRICLVDGALYTLPHFMNGLNEPCFYINRSWMEAVGMPDMPKTLDEFTDLLRAFKTKDPNGNGKADEIPISSSGNVYWYNPIATCFGIPAIDWNEDENHNVFHAVTTQNYKDYLKWSNMIYKEGLLDQRTPTSTIGDQKIEADMKAGLVGMIYTAAITWMDPELAPQFTGFIPVPYGDNATGVWPAGGLLVEGTFAITDKCQYPKAMMRWVNYFGYTQEGILMMSIGKEGETYKLENDVIVDINLPEGMDRNEWVNTWTIQGMHYFPGYYDDYTLRHTADPIVKEVVKAREQLVPITKRHIAPYSLTSEEAEEVSVIQTEISNYIVNSEAKFIMGDMTVEKDWDTYQKTLKDMGLDKWGEVVQAALTRFYNN